MSEPWPDPMSVGVDGDWGAHDAAVRERFCQELDALIQKAGQHVSNACPPSNPDRLTNWALTHLVEGLPL